MENRINKPRVFLSHSSLDKGFIEKLANDLRKCQIEPWLDTEEIRDGKPWLKVIFEEGIPTCDAVIVYLTDNSINSKMVAKELDATIVEELAESGIRLLPYVSKAELRGQLRADIRTLQCREWNEINYNDVLPSVVAEIWHSYTERIVNSATLQEKNRRLELELDMKRMQEKYEKSAFSAAEESEFQYIFKVLNRNIEIKFYLHQRKTDKDIGGNIGEEIYRVLLVNSIIHNVDTGGHYFHNKDLAYSLLNSLGSKVSEDTPDIERGIERDAIKENLRIELQTYGLVRQTLTQSLEYLQTAYEYTEKMYRFKYWLVFNNYPIDKISFERISLIKREENADTKLSENTEIQYAKQVAQDVRFQDERKKWLTTEIGVSAAQQELERLYDELNQIVKRNNEEVAAKDSSMRVELSQENKSQFVLSCRELSLSIVWSCKFDNTLDESLLSVEGYNSKSDLGDGQLEFMDKDRIYQAEYKIDVNEEMNIIWRRTEGSEQPMFTADLAKRYFSYLLSSVRSKSVRGE